MVSKWEIRSAELASDAHETLDGVRRRLPARADRTDVRVVHYFDTGGQLTSVMWGTGDESAETFVRGTVWDESRHAVPGVRVWLSSGRDTAVTDAQGHFSIAGVPPGHYVAMSADSALASIGVSRALPLTVDVLGADQPPIRMLYLDAASAMSLVCPSAAAHAHTGAIVVRVVTAHGSPVTHASVDVYADSVDANTSVHPRQTFLTNSQGYAAACGLPVGQEFWIRARWEPRVAIAPAEVTAADVIALRIVMP